MKKKSFGEDEPEEINLGDCTFSYGGQTFKGKVKFKLELDLSKGKLVKWPKDDGEAVATFISPIDQSPAEHAAEFDRMTAQGFKLNLIAFTYEKEKL